MSIEEMATKYANETEIPGTRAIWKRGFANGANAVLEEIEKALEPEDRGLLYNAIKAKIKELKQ